MTTWNLVRGLSGAAALAAMLAGMPAALVAAEREVVLQHGGLALTGRLVLKDGARLADGVVLLTHGTLAHNGMELIANLQKAMAERGVSSLAITLGLGIDKRQGMFDCAAPHRHRHEDAVEEIGAWLGWLKGEGAAKITLMGHSRGGNQTAWFAAERLDPAVKSVVLLAPATWSAKGRDAGYEKSYKKPLKPVLDRAAALVSSGKGGEMMQGVDFLYCPAAAVSAETFVSYYKSEPRMDTPALLPKIKVPVLVIAGSEDKVVEGLPEAVEPIADGEKVSLAVIDGADHFFLDLYAEDVAEMVASFVAN